MQALLFAEPADHAKHQGIRALRQAKALLQRLLCQSLARQSVGVVSLGHPSIAGRAPDVVIHPIQNAGQAAGARAQQAVQPATLGLGGDFMGVGGADRGDAVSKLEGCLHERHIAKKFKATVLQVGGRQPQRCQRRCRKQTLVGQVVNREHGGGGVAARTGKSAHIRWRQAGMPVVTVNDVGHPVRIQPLPQQGGSPAQGGKTLGVVRPVGAVRTQVGVAGAVIQLR